MRATSISVREIARVLAVSVREVYRLLESVPTRLVRPAGGSSAPVVQGSPGVSDFGGGRGPVVSSGIAVPESICDVQRDGVVLSAPFTGNGGAIATAIVSEYAVRAHRAQLEGDVTDDGRGRRGETNVGESTIAYIQRRIREIVANLDERRQPKQSLVDVKTCRKADA